MLLEVRDRVDTLQDLCVVRCLEVLNQQVDLETAAGLARPLSSSAFFGRQRCRRNVMSKRAFQTQVVGSLHFAQRTV